MSLTVSYLSLRRGLLLLTDTSLSFRTSHSVITGVSTTASVCLPAEAELRRDLLEAQRRFARLRVKNFQLYQ